MPTRLRAGQSQESGRRLGVMLFIPLTAIGGGSWQKAINPERFSSTPLQNLTDVLYCDKGGRPVSLPHERSDFDEVHLHLQESLLE